MAQFIPKVAAQINSATEKTIPVDADMIGIRDSVTGLLNKLSWVNTKATLKTYFDTLYGASIIIQSLGVKNADFTVDVANGSYAKVTTGSAAMNMTLTNGASATIGHRLIVEITQGATARVVTLKAADANVISSGGLMSSGDALPNSGLSTVDIFEFTWNGLKWETTNALFDVKA